MYQKLRKKGSLKGNRGFNPFLPSLNTHTHKSGILAFTQSTGYNLFNCTVKLRRRVGVAGVKREKERREERGERREERDKDKGVGFAKRFHIISPVISKCLTYFFLHLWTVFPEALQLF